MFAGLAGLEQSARVIFGAAGGSILDGK